MNRTKLFLASILIVAMSTFALGASEMIANGSFEDGTPGSGPPLPGWVHSSVSGYGGNTIDWGNWAGAASDGSWVIDLVGTGTPSQGMQPGSVEQTLTTEAGRAYVLTFEIKTNGSPSLLVTIDGNTQTFTSGGAYTSHSVAFTASSSATTIRLEADASYDYLYNNLFLDNVSCVQSMPYFDHTPLVDNKDITLGDASTVHGHNPAEVGPHYGYKPGGGLERLAGTNHLAHRLFATNLVYDVDRPMNFTGNDYTNDDFRAELHVTTPATTPFEIVFFGYGEGELGNYNEPYRGFSFRIHYWPGGGHVDAASSDFNQFLDIQNIGNFDGDAVFVIEKVGSTLTFSIPEEGASKTFDVSDVPNLAEGKLYFGNTTPGTVFESFKVSQPIPPPTELGISGWEMNRGGGNISLGQHIGWHGNPILYDWANIPAEDDAGWGQAPNPETIGFSETSQLPGGCLSMADFTYFQTFLSIPPETQLNEVTVEFYNADDGAQITIYNSLHPNGVSPSDAYIYLGGPSETTDIKQYIAVGEVNRVVITQVDDCPSGNNLQYAAIVLNGTPILQNQAPTADAGSDQTINCAPGVVDVTLSGSGNDADGDALTYSWSDGTSTYSGASVTVSQGGGAKTYTLTVDDGNGGTATDDVTVTVNVDAIAPTIAAIDDISVSNDEGVCGAAVSFEIDAADDCTLASVVADPASGSVFPVGTTEVTVTAADAAGNTASTTFNVTVSDTEAPVITLLGDNPGEVPLYTNYNDPGYEVADNCDDNPSVVVTGSVDINTPGMNELTYTATDANGNVSSVVREVEVVNTPPEVANAVDGVTLSFGDAVLSETIDLASVFSDADTNDVLTYTYSNNDEGVAASDLTGSILTFDAVDLGSSEVTVTATDPWGASVDHTFTVLVNVTEDLAGALLFAHTEIDLQKAIEVYSGNILTNEVLEQPTYRDDDDDDDEDDDDDRSSRGRGRRGGDDDDEDDEDDDDDDDDEDDDDNDGHHGHGQANIRIDKDAYINAGYKIMADRINIKKDGSIGSDVYANELVNKGFITGSVFDNVGTPLFTTLPPFKAEEPGSDDIRVRKRREIVLQPGDYGRVKVDGRGTLTLTGGVYNIEKLVTGKGSRVRFEDGAEVRIHETMSVGSKAYVGPADGSFIGPSDIIFYIAHNHDHRKCSRDDDDDDDDDDKSHTAGTVGARTFFNGTIYAADGKVRLKKDVVFTGAVLAGEIRVDKDADLTLDSYFGDGGGLAKGTPTKWVEPELEVELPVATVLAANYPNPFNPSTTIDFALQNGGHTSLRVYDIRGAEVSTLVSGYREAGHYSIMFSADHLASGTYLYVLESGGDRHVGRMLLMK